MALLDVVRSRRLLKPIVPETLRHAASAIAIVSIDKAGRIIYINEPGIELVKEVTGRERAPRNLIGQDLSKVLNRGLPLTVIGRTLQTGKEVQGKLLAFGKSLYTVMTKLLKKDDSVIGCVEYAIRVRRPNAKDTLLVPQSFARQLANKLGYESTEWIDEISYEHSQQLIRCLCSSNHSVELTEYCPHKWQCAFHPQYGRLALDRRAYRRVEIALPVEVHLLELAHDVAVPEDIREEPTFGTTVNLSVSGVQVRCPVRLPLNSTIQIIFKETEKPITCTGEVVWLKQGDDEEWFTGIKFQSISNEDSSRIVALLNQQELKARKAANS